VSARRIPIAWLAFGYFACYVPYSALTKALSAGVVGDLPAVSGVRLLPAATLASLAGMLTFLTVARWWRHAGHVTWLGQRLPIPGRWTLLSGLATAAILLTTTLSYAIAGASIILMMVLMRGGVLIIAPIVDGLARRRVRGASWAALGLSLAALAVGLEGDPGGLPPAAAAISSIYVGGYFVRLWFMSRLAKTADPDTDRRYFVEEQMVATPAALVALGLLAIAGTGPTAAQLRAGFADLAGAPALPVAAAIGLFSQGTGVFGGLILLSHQENSYCVPVNRASSVLAGVVASAALALLAGLAVPPARELAGAGLLALALAVLALPRHRRRAGTAAT
jgi:hypothetical protein